jgi:hypothetical protein
MREPTTEFFLAKKKMKIHFMRKRSTCRAMCIRVSE